MRMGNKKIYHLEAWVVKTMCLYKVRLQLTCGERRIDRASLQHFTYNFDMSEFD